LADRTVLEVLAYPLDRSGRPDVSAPPQGRFLADRSGFLEPQDYRPGREVTVRGPLLGFKDGQVGTAAYRFPAIAADALKLWAASEPVRRPRVGVSIGAGSYGSGVGIGVGF
jgi:outer membrane lipoprotein